ncbi:MAG: SDR family oxidoreductase [Candidatus Pacearchaeota archaeon]|jgi:NAD(P)-dependent dehydrogenase (short-subunit alcohol dehydrogenase family)
MNALDNFKLTGKTCIITGGAGLLGTKHAEAVLEAGGIPILLDINQEKIDKTIFCLKEKYNTFLEGFKIDITNKQELKKIRDILLSKYGKIDILINNAANNPKVEGLTEKNWTHFENFPEEVWNQDLDVGIKGAFFCSQVFGEVMANQGGGVILNISSDLGIIAPNQELYTKKGLTDEQQNVKPVTYSVVKHALLGLTRYLATYWAKKNIRVNAICPGGVFNNQDNEFLQKLYPLIPMQRMADKDEYKSAILFLISDASSYMTGSVISIDGGRTCW